MIFEVEDILHLCRVFVIFFRFEVFFLAGVADEFEVQEAVSGVYFIDYHIVGVVAVFSGSDLDLLDIAQAVVLGALADGEDAVKEVVEFL